MSNHLNIQIQTVVKALTTEDIQQYAKDGIWDLVQGVIMSDPFAIASGIRNVKELVFQMPTLLFWNKMQRYLLGTFHNLEEQTKMAQKFSYDNEQYAIFMKRMFYMIYDIEDDLKIDYIASLTRSYLLTSLQKDLFFKLSKFLTICTSEELDFLASSPFDIRSPNTTMISSLYQYGLFQQESSDDNTGYVLSDFGKALKQNSLNISDKSPSGTYLTSYEALAPLPILEPASNREVDEMISQVFSQ